MSDKLLQVAVTQNERVKICMTSKGDEYEPALRTKMTFIDWG